jgi:hypothetical protein
MTVDFVNFMEKLAYYTAQEIYCMPPRESQKISMVEMFDMIAGSETGAMIGGALVVPNTDPATKDKQINKWFASETNEFFWNEVPKLYVDQQMPLIWKFLVFLLSILIISGLTYYCFYRKYRLKKGYLEKLE